MCICVYYVCTCVCVCLCVNVCLCVCVCECVCVCVYLQTFLKISVSCNTVILILEVYVCLCVHVFVFVCICLCVCVFLCIAHVLPIFVCTHLLAKNMGGREVYKSEFTLFTKKWNFNILWKWQIVAFLLLLAPVICSVLKRFISVVNKSMVFYKQSFSKTRLCIFWLTGLLGINCQFSWLLWTIWFYFCQFLSCTPWKELSYKFLIWLGCVYNPNIIISLQFLMKMKLGTVALPFFLL